MTPEAQRKFNIAAGTLSLLFGLAAWAAAGYVALTPAQPRPTPAAAAPVIDLASCAQVLASLGFSTSVKDGRVEAFRAGYDEPQKLLHDASLGIALCKLELQRFCMGEECPQPGLMMTLSPARSAGSNSSATPVPAPQLRHPAVPMPAPAPRK